MILACVTIVGVCLAILYSLIIKKLAPDKWWDWSHALVSTMVSVLLGVFSAFIVYNVQAADADAKKKSDFKILMQEEFSDLYQVLSSKDFVDFDSGKAKHKVLIAFIQPLIIEDAARSGLFKPVDTNNLLHLARKIRAYNLEVQFFISAIMSPTQGQHGGGDFAAINIEKTRRAILLDLRSQANILGFDILLEPVDGKYSSPRTPLTAPK